MTSASLRLGTLLKATSIVVGLVPLATAVTTSANMPGNCQIIGDADVYGLGIRLNYYLQWAAIVFATWIAPEQVEPARLTSNIVTISVYANAFRGVTHHNLIVAEWWIVYLMTFVLTLGFIPRSTILLKKSIYSFGFLGLLWGMIIFAHCWVWFRGVDVEHKEGCMVKIVYLFCKVDVENKRWRAVFKIESVIICIGGLLGLLFGLFKAFWSKPAEESDNTRNDDEKAVLYSVNAGLTVFQFLVGVMAIVHIEWTIKINGIDLSATPITSSGQLIPFLAGIFTLAATFAPGFNRLLSSLRSRVS